MKKTVKRIGLNILIQYNAWQQAKNELDGRNEIKRIQRDIELDSTRREVGNLMQIIRILAKDPTLTMVNNQDDNGNPRFR